MIDYIVKISMSERIKDPAIVLDRLFEGTFVQNYSDGSKYLCWTSLETPDGKVVAERSGIDWGL